MVLSSSSLQPPENVAVVLEISSGSFDDGFCVQLQILEDGKIIEEHNDLTDIPPASAMPQLYQEWQNISLNNSRQLQAVPGQVTNIAHLVDWRQRSEELENYCQIWFQNQAFRSLRDSIRANIKVTADQSVPIIIRCQTANHQQNNILRRLPWHIWDLFYKLPNAEFALFTRFRPQVATFKAPVKILAIFGSSQGGLQLEEDKKALKLLEQRGAEITWILEPTEEKLSYLLFERVWDILFFAGHSSSETTGGQIQISQGKFLPLDALRQSLRKAVDKGLKLAIFNSCDGLGIADFLTQLNVPSVIVMREPVPDRIAGQFLLYFLREFSQGTPLCLAVREARNRLEALQGTFPAASWLPVVCLNPNQPEFVWPAKNHAQETVAPPRLLPFFLRSQILLGLAAVTGIITVAILITINWCQIFSSFCKAPVEPINIQNFISSGEKEIANSKVKLSQPYLSFKQQGIKALSQGKYAEAFTIFDNLRNQAKLNKDVPGLRQAALEALKDPAILIYRNNAFVNLQHQQNPNLRIYTIAVAAPLNDNAGLDILFGVAQAQDVAVKEGINLQVVIANDLNQPSQSQKVAKQLSQDDKILAVVGHFTSPNTCAALKIYSPKQLVVISPTSTLVQFRANPDCGSDINQVFFRTTSSSYIEARSLVEYLVKPDGLNKPQPKVVVFYNSQESFSKDLFTQFTDVIRKEFDGTIIATFDLSDPNLDIKQLPKEATNADALVLLPDGRTNDDNTALEKAINIIKLNKGKKPILGANTLYLQEVINKTQNTTVNSLFLADDWHPKQCGAAAFAQKVNDYWAGDLNGRMALSYEAVQAAVQAIKLSGESVNRQQIRQKLADTDKKPETAAFSSVIQGWKISFNTRGDRKEITTQPVFTVNKELRFDIAKDIPCSQK
jgi:branched-chain amino acid transport system substrate-binding protein